MNCEHPRRLIVWTDSTQHIIVTDRRHDHQRQTIRNAGQVALVCLDCGQSDAFDGPDDVPTWILRVMRETAPEPAPVNTAFPEHGTWGVPTYRLPVVMNETAVHVQPKEDDTEGAGA